MNAGGISGTWRDIERYSAAVIIRLLMQVFKVLQLGLFAQPLSAEEMSLARLEGLWAQVEPSGEPVRFTLTGKGRLEGTGLTFVAGPATVMVSSGEFGSDLKISGPGSFNCYYKLLIIKSETAFQWIFRGGNDSCPKTAFFKQAEVAPEKRSSADDRPIISQSTQGLLSRYLGISIGDRQPAGSAKQRTVVDLTQYGLRVAGLYEKTTLSLHGASLVNLEIYNPINSEFVSLIVATESFNSDTGGKTPYLQLLFSQIGRAMGIQEPQYRSTDSKVASSSEPHPLSNTDIVGTKITCSASRIVDSPALSQDRLVLKYFEKSNIITTTVRSYPSWEPNNGCQSGFDALRASRQVSLHTRVSQILLYNEVLTRP